MTGGDDRPDLSPVHETAAPFTLVAGPRHEVAPDRSPLAGFYVATFAASDGSRVSRFLSDMGYAEVIRRKGEGRTAFSAEELERWTTPPSLEAIESRYDAEAGQGA
ncbi:MAG TPA: hypothetical protein VF044_06145 [Actinomycetota bacterium]